MLGSESIFNLKISKLKMKEVRKMRGIWRFLIVAILISLLTTSMHNSACASEVEVITWEYDPGPPESWKRTVEYEVSTEQLIVGAIVKIAILKIIFGCPDAFYNVEPPLGWTYETDGETYLNLHPPDTITSPGSWIFSWESHQPDTRKFKWKTYGAGGVLLEEGPVLGGPSIPTSSYWGLIGLILVLLTSGVWLFFKRRKAVGVRS